MPALNTASLGKARPSYIRKSMYGPATADGLPKMRAADLPGMVALPVQSLFPDIPKAIYVEGDDLGARPHGQPAIAGEQPQRSGMRRDLPGVSQQHPGNHVGR